MPTVRTYGGQQVGREALPGVRKTAAETEISSGVGLHIARARTFETIAAVGEGVARQSLAQFAALEEAGRRQSDELADLAAETALAQWEERRLFDPASGVFAMKGKAALALPETVGAEFDQVAGTIAAGLGTDTQRVRFARTRERHRANLAGNVFRHVERETAAYEAGELQSFVAVTQSLAIGNALEPRRVAEDLAALETRIRTSAPRAGLGPTAVDHAVGVARSTVHVGVIRRLVEADRVGMASAYFAAAKDQIDGAALEDVERALGTATTAVAALEASEELWTAHGPTADDDPIALDVMETAARARFANDPAKLKATIHSLRERKAGVDESRKDRKEAVAGALWTAVAQGATLADVRRMPEYLTAPGVLQLQVAAHVVTEAEKRATRGDATSARAEAEKERAGWSMLWHYDTPAVLAQMSDNQILALLPNLGIDHVNRLMTKKRDLVKSAATVHAATIDDDLFKTTAQTAGLDAYTPKTDAQKSALGQLRNVVETAIDQEQQRAGRALTRDQKQTLMQGVIDRRVMVDRWGGDASTPAAMVVNPTDRAAAYVPIGEIPERSQVEWVNVIRSRFPAAQRLSRDQILHQYRDRIQRAHAAAVLGLGSAEETRRLQGR